MYRITHARTHAFIRLSRPERTGAEEHKNVLDCENFLDYENLWIRAYWDVRTSGIELNRIDELSIIEMLESKCGIELNRIDELNMKGKFIGI